jgi:hypothetical protein
MEDINNITKLSAKEESREKITKAPTPYIGQIGPYKKPLLTNFLLDMEQYKTSQNHPKKLYKINNKNI